MPRLRLKSGVDDSDLLRYGFKKSRHIKHPDFIRQIEGVPLYRVYFTDKHRYLQIQLGEQYVVSSSLQYLIYKLTQDGLLEEVEEVA